LIHFMSFSDSFSPNDSSSSLNMAAACLMLACLPYMNYKSHFLNSSRSFLRG